MSDSHSQVSFCIACELSEEANFIVRPVLGIIVYAYVNALVCKSMFNERWSDQSLGSLGYCTGHV